MSAGPAEALATAGTLAAKPSALVAGEKLVLSGAVSPKLKRTVVLQRKSGSSWVKVAKKSSAPPARSRSRPPAPAATTKYRVYAPAATIGGKRRAAVATPVRTVTTQPQTASLTLAATGRLGGSSTAASTFSAGACRTAGDPGAARGRATPGRPTAPARSPPTGQATFPVAHVGTGTFTFRVVAEAWKGAAETVSAVRTIVVSAAERHHAAWPRHVRDRHGSDPVVADPQLDQPRRRGLRWSGDPPGRRVATPPATPTSGTFVADKGPGATSHVDSGLADGTTYSYAVFAYDEVPNYAAAATGQGATTTSRRHDTAGPGHVGHGDRRDVLVADDLVDQPG